jgi:hypothetical protein
VHAAFENPRHFSVTGKLHSWKGGETRFKSKICQEKMFFIPARHILEAGHSGFFRMYCLPYGKHPLDAKGAIT